MSDAHETQVIEVEHLGERLSGLRLCEPAALASVRRSLEQHGQLMPLLVFADAGELEVLDGFKRVRAARALGWSRLYARIDEVSPRVGMTVRAMIHARTRSVYLYASRDSELSIAARWPAILLPRASFG
jgi:hypothetical protein